MSKEKFKVVPAVHLLLVRDGKVLLSRRYNTGWMDGNYSVPAGHVDGDEAARMAMIREVREEIGVEIAEANLQLAHVMHRRTPEGKANERVDFFFTISSWKGEPTNMEPNKCDELRWVDLNTLPDNIIPYVKQGIEHYRKGSFYSEICFVLH